jgi:hypothetical protein
MNFVGVPCFVACFSIREICNLDIYRHWHTLVGHLPLLSSFSACKSSLPHLTPDRPHMSIFFQNRNMESQKSCVLPCCGCMVSWTCSEHIRYALYSPGLHSMFSFTVPISRRLDNGAAFAQVILGPWTHKYVIQR